MKMLQRFLCRTSIVFNTSHVSFALLAPQIPYLGFCSCEEQGDTGVWQLVDPPILPLTHGPNHSFDWRETLLQEWQQPDRTLWYSGTAAPTPPFLQILELSSFSPFSRESLGFRPQVTNPASEWWQSLAAWLSVRSTLSTLRYHPPSLRKCCEISTKIIRQLFSPPY